MEFLGRGRKRTRWTGLQRGEPPGPGRISDGTGMAFVAAFDPGDGLAVRHDLASQLAELLVDPIEPFDLGPPQDRAYAEEDRRVDPE